MRRRDHWIEWERLSRHRWLRPGDSSADTSAFFRPTGDAADLPHHPDERDGVAGDILGSNKFFAKASRGS